MARPDTDDGWLRYAHELDAAIALADFTRAARVVLHEALAQIYGPAKLRSAELHPNGIAARCGILRQMISRGLAELIADGVLTREPDGRYRFAKNYEAWTKGGKPRFSPVQVAYAKGAPARAMSYKFGGVSDQSHNETSGINPVAEPASIQLPAPEPEATESLLNGINPVASKATESLPRSAAAYRNAGAEFKTETETNAAAAGASDDGRKPEPKRKAEVIPAVPPAPADPAPYRPTYPAGDKILALLDVASGPHEIPDAKAREIFDLVWELTGRDQVCWQFYEQQRRHSAAVWVRAITELRRQGKTPYSLGLVHSVAGRIEVEPPGQSRRAEPARPKQACEEYMSAATLAAKALAEG